MKRPLWSIKFLSLVLKPFCAKVNHHLHFSEEKNGTDKGGQISVMMLAL